METIANVVPERLRTPRGKAGDCGHACAAEILPDGGRRRTGEPVVELLSTEFSADKIISLRRLLRVVHHVPGRLRVRLVGGGVPSSHVGSLGGSLGDFRRFVEGIPGVERLRISPATFSAVVEYDQSVLPPSAWDSLMTGPEQAARQAFKTLTAGSEAG